MERITGGGLVRAVRMLRRSGRSIQTTPELAKEIGARCEKVDYVLSRNALHIKLGIETLADYTLRMRMARVRAYVRDNPLFALPWLAERLAEREAGTGPAE